MVRSNCIGGEIVSHDVSGTGTLVGDPIEMKAIGTVFRDHRSAENPLYVPVIR